FCPPLWEGLQSRCPWPWAKQGAATAAVADGGAAHSPTPALDAYAARTRTDKAHRRHPCLRWSAGANARHLLNAGSLPTRKQQCCESRLRLLSCRPRNFVEEVACSRPDRLSETWM